MNNPIAMKKHITYLAMLSLLLSICLLTIPKEAVAEEQYQKKGLVIKSLPLPKLFNKNELPATRYDALSNGPLAKFVAPFKSILFPNQANAHSVAQSTENKVIRLSTGTSSSVMSSSSIPTLINFSEYYETIITTQYQNLGVVFSGDQGPPVIPDDAFGWNWATPPAHVLCGPLIDNNGQVIKTGPITVKFVDPNDGSPISVTNVSFQFFIRNPGISKATYFDLNETTIREDILPLGQSTGYTPPIIHGFTISDSGSSGIITMGNLSFQFLQAQSDLGDPCPLPDDDDCADHGDPCDPGSGCGSPVWSVNKINMNLHVKDIPLWYRSPIGPPVKIALSYNSQAGITNRQPFGNKWQFNYGSYLDANTLYNGENVTVYMPDGRRDVYKSDGLGGYTSPYSVYNTLSKISSGRYYLTFPDDTIYVYDSSGYQQPVLVEIRDPHYPNDNSLKLSIAHDSNGNVTTITDATGRLTTLTYNNGLVMTATTTGPSGQQERQAEFGYTNNNLTLITDMGGYTATLEYESGHNFITKISNARGTWLFYTEPADNAIPPGGTYTTDMYYPPPGGTMYANYRITVTNPLRNKEEYYYCGVCGDYPFSYHVTPKNYMQFVNATNNNFSSAPKRAYYITPVFSNIFEKAQIYQMLLRGGNITYGYNASGDLISKQYDQKTWQYAYNSKGFPTSKTEPNGTITTMQYAANNIDLISTTISNGSQSLGTETRTYNGPHDVQSVTDRMGKTTTFEYNNNYGQVSKTIQDPSGLNIETDYNYDSGRRLNSITRATSSGQQTLHSYTYDNLDRVSTHTDPTGLTLAYFYNNLDQVDMIAYPGGKFKSFQYSTCCPFRLDSITERFGKKTLRTTYFSYDVMNHLLSVTEPGGTVTSFGYDFNGNRTSITDPKGQTTRFGYDNSNRLTSKTYADRTPDNPSETYSYTGVTKLIATRTNARGVTINYSYNNLEKLISYNDSPSGPATTFGYDNFGRRTSAASPAGTLTFTYDNNSRLVSVSGPWSTSTVAYTYDALGRRTDMTRGKGHAVHYDYDALNRLTGVTIGSRVYTYGYAGVSSLVQSLTRPEGNFNASYQYDELNRLTEIADFDPIWHNTFSHDYTYNDKGQRATETFDFEPPYVNEQAAYTYNNVNELLTVSDPAEKQLAYDLDGNLTQGYTPAGQQFTASYDSHNHLTSLSYGSNQVVNYSYVGNVLVKKTSTSNGETRYVYDGFKITQERNSANTLVNEYTYGLGLPGGIGGLLHLKQAGMDYSYLYDGRGNVTMLVDGNGFGAGDYQYDPFGVPLDSGGISQPMQFSTKPYDPETGLSYYGYRFYAANLGRWMTRDPIGERGGINLYGFVGNNPINWVDPWGLRDWCKIGSGSIVVINGIGQVFAGGAVISYAIGEALTLTPLAFFAPAHIGTGGILMGAGITTGIIGGKLIWEGWNEDNESMSSILYIDEYGNIFVNDEYIGNTNDRPRCKT